MWMLNLLTLISVLSASTASTYDYTKCNQFFNGRLWLLAAHCYKAGLDGTAPKERATYLNLLGVTYYEMRRYNEALAYYQMAIEHVPSVAIYHFNLGLASIGVNSSNITESLPYFEAAIQLEPQESKYPFYLANLFFKNKQWKDAEYYYRKGLAINDDRADVWNILGIACFEQRRFVPAVYAYRIAVAMEPTNYVHHYNLGLALYHVKRAPPGWFEEAAHHISIALDKNPTNEEYITTLGHIYFKLHQYENATSCYQKLLKMGNTPDPTILNLKAVASVNRMNQEFDEKSHHFVRIDPESGRMTVERDGAYFTDVAALTEVAASYKMALELKPNDAVYYYNLGNLEFGQDNLTEALRWFDKAIALDPNVAEYHSVKGLCLLELEEHEKAAKEFGIAMRLQPGNVMHPFNKGRALFKLERFFEAAQAFERAALLEPNNPNIQNWWGTALVHQGYDELAAPMFNKAAALDQNQNLYHVFFDGMLWNFGKDWQPPANYSSPAI